MKVYVYAAVEGDAPRSQTHVARIWCEMIGKGNKVTAAREKAENIARGVEKRAEKRAAA